MKYQDRFVSMKKIYRLACYKEHKESHPELNRVKRIADICPFKFTEIKEECKHCRWFQIVDETKPIKQQIIDEEVGAATPLLIKLEDFEELPYDPKLDKDPVE